jgi:hypothetical protein
MAPAAWDSSGRPAVRADGDWLVASAVLRPGPGGCAAVARRWHAGKMHAPGPCPARTDRPADLSGLTIGWAREIRSGRYACPTRPAGVRTGSGSGRPAPPTRPQSPCVARCDTRSTAAVLATVR